MRPKISTTPNLAATSPAHQAAITEGDKHFGAWQHNVADRFKSMEVEDIKKELRETANPFAICMEHLIGDFNFGTVVRNANAFNAREVFYLGDKKWDKRAAVGTFNYTDVTWLPTVEDFVKLRDQYVIIGVDNVPGSVPVSSYSFSENTLLVLGEEGVGLTPAMQSMCRNIVHIEQYGSVRSLNVGTASGIIMHEFMRQMKNKYSDSMWDE